MVRKVFPKYIPMNVKCYVKYKHIREQHMKQARKWIDQEIWGQVSLETSGFGEVVPLLRNFSEPFNILIS